MNQLEYSQIGRWLSIQELSRFIDSVETSEVVEIADESLTGRLNHIVLKGKSIPIAYFGADNQIELVNPEDNSLKIPHAYIKGLYEGCLDENQRLII